MRREKSAFDHIQTDWNLPNEDGSTDFSDDDTVIDERVRFRSVPFCSPNVFNFPEIPFAAP